MKRKKDVWKILAIVFIVLFAVIILLGLFRAREAHLSSEMAAGPQTALARDIAVKDLEARGVDIGNLSFWSSNRVRTVMHDGAETNVTDVTFGNDSVQYFYLIDVTDGRILVTSQTAFVNGFRPMSPEGNGSRGRMVVVARSGFANGFHQFFLRDDQPGLPPPPAR